MVYTVSGIRFPVVPSLHNKSSFRGGDRRNAAAAPVSFFLKKDSRSRTALAVKFSHDSDSTSSAIAESDKVLVPQDLDNSASLTDEVETPDITTEDVQNLEDLATEDENTYTLDEAASSYSEVDDGQGSVVSSLVDVSTSAQTKKTSVHSDMKVIEINEVKPRIIPPPGIGQKIYEIDPFLQTHRDHLDFRYAQYKRLREEIDKYEGGLDAFSRGYEKFGFARSATGITYREWAPGAKSAALVGDFNNWNPNADVMTRNEFGVWEIFLPNNADGSPAIPHGSRVKSSAPYRSCGAMNLEEIGKETASYTRESKVIPNFKGEDAYRWLINKEQHCEAVGIAEKEKLSEAEKALAGNALRWWFFWKRRNHKATWWDFLKAVLKMFQPEFDLDILFGFKIQRSKKVEWKMKYWRT